MAVAFGTASQLVDGARTSSVYPAPSGIADGDYLILVHFQWNGAGMSGGTSPPGGFAVLPGGSYPSDPIGGDNFEVWAWYKKAASEAGDYTVTHGGTNQSRTTHGTVVRVTGADPDTPFAPTNTFNSGYDTSGTTSFTGLTTAVDDELIIAISVDDNDYTNDLSAPGGTTPIFTERIDTPGIYVATGVLASHGATGGKTMTNNCSTTLNAPWWGILIAMQPAAGAPPTPDPATLRVITTPRLV